MDFSLIAIITNLLIAFVVLLIVTLLFSKLTTGVCTANACLIGKTAIVTGGNSGLGYEAVLGLAARGARVIIADVADSEEKRKSAIRETGNPNILSMHVDLADNQSIRKFAKEFKQIADCRLDILLNNAGIGKALGRKNKDGIDLCMQVNYLGPFLLTHCLADVLKSTEKSRIVFTSSMLLFCHDLTISNLVEENDWNYCRSKLCLIIACSYFAEKLKSHDVTSNSVHPGLVKTPIHQCFNRNSVTGFTWLLTLQIFGKTSYEGGQTILDAAMNSKWNNVTDQFFSDCKPFYKPHKFYDEGCRKVIIAQSKKLVDLQSDEEL